MEVLLLNNPQGDLKANNSFFKKNHTPTPVPVHNKLGVPVVDLMKNSQKCTGILFPHCEGSSLQKLELFSTKDSDTACSQGIFIARDFFKFKPLSHHIYNGANTLESCYITL